jgi:hypothetical protein
MCGNTGGHNISLSYFPPARLPTHPLPTLPVERCALGSERKADKDHLNGARSETKRQSTAHIQSSKKPSQKKKVYCYILEKKKSIPFPPLHTLGSRCHHVIDFADHRKCTAIICLRDLVFPQDSVVFTEMVRSETHAREVHLILTLAADFVLGLAYLLSANRIASCSGSDSQ